MARPCPAVYLAVTGPGQYDKDTAEGPEAVDRVAEFIDRACDWLEVRVEAASPAGP